MKTDIRVDIKDVELPGKSPLARLERPGLTVLLMQAETDASNIIWDARGLVTFTEWVTWLKKFEDPSLDPVLAWVDPEKFIPEKYWRYHIAPGNIPPALAMPPALASIT